MQRSFRMTIQQATKDYEHWLGAFLEIIPEDLAAKHQRMAAAIFPFLRATYYRWAQLFPYRCKELSRAPQVLAVGDLHVENFGTWRDAEGRLVWGINDFDETWRLPYAHDLVRLATSAHLAIDGGHLKITAREACESLLGGYREGLEAGGRPFVLAEHSKALRSMATARLADPQRFWDKLDSLPTWKAEVPARVVKALSNLLPEPDLPRRVVHRVAGLGSLGRQRFVALADWQGGKIAREAKALAPSAAVWAFGGEGMTRVLYQSILDQSVRSVDPWVKVRRRWIVRRLAPDCSRVELSELPEEREETRLLRAMGWETANVHLGSRSAHALLVDLAARPDDWLHHAAKAMLAAVAEDWEAWRKHPIEVVIKPAAAAAALAIVPPIAAAEGGEGGAGAAPGVEASGKEGGGKAAVAGAVGSGGKGDKGMKVGKAAKDAKASKKEKNRKGGKRDKTVKAEKAGREQAGAGGDAAAKGAKLGKAAKGGKIGKVAKGATIGKVAKAGKGDKPGKPAKAAKVSGTVKAAEHPAAAVGGGGAREAKVAKAKGANQAVAGKAAAPAAGAEAAAGSDGADGATTKGAKRAKGAKSA
jgi:hypothetical protein